MSWSLLTDWEIHYAALCNVPSNSDDYERYLPGLRENGGIYQYKENLGNWLHRQRQAKKGQGKWKLSVEEEAQLQKLVADGKVAFYSVCQYTRDITTHFYVLGKLRWNFKQSNKNTTVILI